MLEKNKIYKTHITSYTDDGDGVGRVDNIAVFVPGSCEGDELDVRIIKTKKTYAIGKIEQLITPSPQRCQSPCAVSEKCGGCSVMHISYGGQLEMKKRHIADCLERIGGFSGIKINEPLRADEPLRYRNKMIFPIGGSAGNAVGGFYAAKSHRIIPAEDCVLGSKIASDALRCLTALMNKYKIPPYDELTHKGLVRRLMVRLGMRTGEAMAVVSINGGSLPHAEELIAALCTIESDEFRFTSIVMNINRGRNNLVLGENNKTIYGNGFIRERLCGLSFKISPNSFFQVNTAQAEGLYSEAVRALQLTGDETVLDLYCGTGTIGLCCASRAKKIIGVEIVEQAIADAKENAAANNIKNAEFFTGSAGELAQRLADKGIMPDAAVIDPPRKGIDEQTVNALLKMSPQKIVYVSCNPSTLARDLKILTENELYKISKVAPVDMFPFTAHVETVVLMSRK